MRTARYWASLTVLAACGSAEAPVDSSSQFPGGETTNTLILGNNAFIRPAENILPEHEADFFSGNSLFNQSWVTAPASTDGRDGLGPLFNARSCSGCHFRDGRGQPPTSGGGQGEEHLGLLLRLSIPGVDDTGAPLPDPVYGGQLQPLGLAGVPSEGLIGIETREIPGEYGDGEAYALLEPTYSIASAGYGPLSDEVMVSPRVAPQVIGLGLLEAIPEARIRSLADPDDADGDGISGRPNSVWDAEASSRRLGRFGWKAEQPSVRQQSAGAFLGDMGITSPVFGDEACSDAETECQATANGGAPEISAANFDKLVRYTSLLAVPMRRDAGAAEVARGEGMFAEFGCGGCHTPSHETGEHPDLIEVSHQKVWPYTDLLLHDMGEALADHRPVFDASGTEWKTPPLWGLGLIEAVNGHTRFLHDGRARSLAEAVLWHGGEAEAARERFRTASKTNREALVRFLESL